MTDTTGMLNTEAVGRRLGQHPMIAAYIITTLGVSPDGRDRRAVLWSEASFQLICKRQAEHSLRIANEYRTDRPKQPATDTGAAEASV